MNSREKKLLGLVLIVFLVAVGDFLMSALNEFQNESMVASCLLYTSDAADEL